MDERFPSLIPALTDHAGAYTSIHRRRYHPLFTPGPILGLIKDSSRVQGSEIKMENVGTVCHHANEAFEGRGRTCLVFQGE